jgi:cardiolipin synthase
VTLGSRAATVLLTTCPWVPIARRRRGGREISVRQILALAGVILLGLASAACARVPSHFAVPQLAVADPAFIPTIEAYAIAPVGSGNTVDVLLNGDQIFPALLAAIRSARETITYAQYFYEEGPIAREIAEAFAERCRAGAEYRETMTRAGCQVATFRPLSPLSLVAVFGVGRANKRNHRRILVVDGRIGFTGGSGVSPKWMGDGRTRDHWRDTDVRVEGPVVASLQGAFVENWLDATNDVLGGESYFPRPSRPGAVSAQIVRSSPAGGSFSMYTMFLLAITSARRSIYVTNPYFLPDARMTLALIDAPGRGVRVVVLLPGAIDNNIVRQASRSKFGELLKAGIEIYEYQAGLLHAKVMTVDGIWATIGSTNLDSRSFALNEEVNAVVYHTSVVAKLEEVFAEDLKLLEILSLPVREQL